MFIFTSNNKVSFYYNSQYFWIISIFILFFELRERDRFDIWHTLQAAQLPVSKARYIRYFIWEINKLREWMDEIHWYEGILKHEGNIEHFNVRLTVNMISLYREIYYVIKSWDFSSLLPPLVITCHQHTYPIYYYAVIICTLPSRNPRASAHQKRIKYLYYKSHVKFVTV